MTLHDGPSASRVSFRILHPYLSSNPASWGSPISGVAPSPMASARSGRHAPLPLVSRSIRLATCSPLSLAAPLLACLLAAALAAPSRGQVECSTLLLHPEHSWRTCGAMLDRLLARLARSTLPRTVATPPRTSLLGPASACCSLRRLCTHLRGATQVLIRLLAFCVATLIRSAVLITALQVLLVTGGVEARGLTLGLALLRRQ